VLGDRHEVAVEAAHQCGGSRLAAQHAQQIVGVSAFGVGREGLRAVLPPLPGGGEHGDRARQPEAAALEALLAGLEGGHARAERLHGVLALESRTQPRERAEGEAAALAEPALQRIRACRVGQAPVPEQAADVLEAPRRELLDRVAAHDQPATFAVHPRKRRLGGDHVLEAGRKREMSSMLQSSSVWYSTF